jgi:hypothetical protein
MYALALCIALLFNPQQPVKKHIPAQQKQDHAVSNANNQPLPPSTGNSPISQVSSTSEAPRNESKSLNPTCRVEIAPQPTDNWFKGYVVATVVIAALNLLLLIVVWLQRKTMIEQLAEMKTTREKTVAEMQAAGEQTRQLIMQTESTAKATRDSADALIASERAWIMVEVIPAGNNPQIIRNQDGTIGVDARCVCENQGKTGAWINEIRCALEFSPLRLPEEPNLDDIGPYDSVPRPIASRKNPETYIIQPGCRGDWNNKILILYGVVKYRDMFGKDRQTTFGYVVGKNGEFKRIVGYPKYNENT